MRLFKKHFPINCVGMIMESFFLKGPTNSINIFIGFIEFSYLDSIKSPKRGATIKKYVLYV